MERKTTISIHESEFKRFLALYLLKNEEVVPDLDTLNWKYFNGTVEEHPAFVTLEVSWSNPE